MATIVANMSMSLDGFIADSADGVEYLFGWYGNGDFTAPTADPHMTFHVSEASADHLRGMLANVGALVCGRRLFDIANGWGGTHPTGAPVFVVTHSIPEGWPRDDAPFTFITEGGVERAVAEAKAVAGDKIVAIASANITQECLNAGLLDAIAVDLVPVLLGAGIRFFDHLRGAPITLENPQVVEGTAVTHLYYRVKPPC
jgi:dihydrofolate reductase